MTLYFPVLHVPYGFWFRARPIPPAMFIVVTTQLHAHLHPRKLTWNPKIDDLKLVDVVPFPRMYFQVPC